MSTPLRVLPPVLARRRLLLLLRLIANGLIQAGAAFATARLIKYAFDGVIYGHGTGSPPGLLWLGTGLAASAVALSLLRWLELSDAERMGQDYVNDVRVHLFDCLRNSAVRSLQRYSRGAMMLRFVGDLNALRRWVSLGLARLTTGGVTIVAAVAALAFLSWSLALTAGAVLSVGALALLGRGSRMREAVTEARRWRSRLAANVNEKIASLAVMQVFGRSDRERERVARQSDRLKNAMVRQASVTGQLRGISEATTIVASGAVLLVGSLEVSAGQTTPGTVVAAMGIVGLLNSPLRNLARVYEYWQGANISRQKIKDFLGRPAFVEERPEAPDLSVRSGCLEFCGITVAGSVKHFSAVIEPGQRVALVGPNGAGKSSLLMAVARLVTLEAGAIFLDGQDLALHSLASVHRAVSMLGPDLPLMRGSIENNLRYRWPDAPEEELVRVVRLCGIQEILTELPEGLDTRISEGGANLSPGQRQRIALARAIMGSPSVLLLDEADENLDPRASLVLDRVFGDYPGTVLVVTHRYDRAAGADVVWYLEDGRLVEAGPPGRAAGAGRTDGAPFP